MKFATFQAQHLYFLLMTSSGLTAGLTAASTVISAKAQFLDQVKINSTSQLIIGIFELLQKLLKCFSRITTLVSFIPTLFASYLGLSISLPLSSLIFLSTL